MAHPAMAELAHHFHGALAMAKHGLHDAARSGWLRPVSSTAYVFYMVAPAIPSTLAKVLRPLIVVLENKYFLDWFNENVLARLARACWAPALWKGATAC